MLHSSGQPRLPDPDKGVKFIVYSAFCLDGSCLPPVIFSSKPVPAPNSDDNMMTVDRDLGAWVFYTPDIEAPGTKSTQIYIERVSRPKANYFSKQPFIILDALRGHFSAESMVEWQLHGVTLVRLPKGLGKWLNPCDQAIHREIRRKYRALQSENPNDQLRNIIRAYYSVKDETVRRSFSHCGIPTGDVNEKVMHQACQGYMPSPSHEVELSEQYSAFMQLCVKKTRSPDDFLPTNNQVQALDSALDGRKAARFGTTRSRWTRSDAPVS
jgi:hypothetical protein